MKKLTEDLLSILEYHETPYEKVKELIDKGADTNGRGKDDYTPLMIAAQRGLINECNLLLEKGASVNAQTMRGVTALYNASLEGYSKVSIFLIHHKSIVDIPTRTDPDQHGISIGTGITPLFWAAHHGDSELCKLLIKEGAIVNRFIAEGFLQGDTPLHWAVIAQQSQVCKILIDAGVSIDAQNYQGMTPLHEAAYRGYTSLAALLLNEGADRTLQDNDGTTAGDLAKAHSKELSGLFTL